MAQMDLKYPVYAPLIEDEVAGTFAYGTGKVAAKAIKVDVSLNISDAPLYADGAVAERIRDFIDGTLNFTPDDLDDTVKSEWLGSELVDETIDTQTVKVLKSNTDDMPGFFGFGCIIPKIKNKVKKYRAILFTKVQFAEPNESAETKGQNIAWQTPSIEGKLMRRIDGNWKEETTVDSFNTAVAWLKTKLNLPPVTTLSNLIIGALALTPPFSRDVTSYTAATTNAEDIILATPTDPAASVAIEVGGTPVVNGQAATWAVGANTVTITVTNGTATKVYTVIVTKS